MASFAYGAAVREDSTEIPIDVAQQSHMNYSIILININKALPVLINYYWLEFPPLKVVDTTFK